ncbi:hypothetical protein ANN_12732 [Periplaneta americana]|uniref:Uncharacterized protein n=1 Tax=Periplaneta americana TaxID=6978 RepID=A0ABQ8TIS5_PERAM|nr:hypothetical protein ANN_12732 [Periplaneta americana]
MAGFCEGGNEPSGSLKAIYWGEVWRQYGFPMLIWEELGVPSAYQQSLTLAGSKFQSLGRAIVKEDEYEDVRWDGIVVVITEDVQNVHLLLEYRPHIDVSLTCEYEPKLQNMPQFNSEGIPNQAPETNKPMILNGPTSRNRDGSDQKKSPRVIDLVILAAKRLSRILCQSTSRKIVIKELAYPQCEKENTIPRKDLLEQIQILLSYFSTYSPPSDIFAITWDQLLYPYVVESATWDRNQYVTTIFTFLLVDNIKELRERIVNGCHSIRGMTGILECVRLYIIKRDDACLIMKSDHIEHVLNAVFRQRVSDVLIMQST